MEKQHRSFPNEQVSLYSHRVAGAFAYRYCLDTAFAEQAFSLLFVQRYKQLVLSRNAVNFKRVADDLTIYIVAVCFDAKIGSVRVSNCVVDVNQGVAINSCVVNVVRHLYDVLHVAWLYAVLFKRGDLLAEIVFQLLHIDRLLTGVVFAHLYVVVLFQPAFLRALPLEAHSHYDDGGDHKHNNDNLNQQYP